MCKDAQMHKQSAVSSFSCGMLCHEHTYTPVKMQLLGE